MQQEHWEVFLRFLRFWEQDNFNWQQFVGGTVLLVFGIVTLVIAAIWKREQPGYSAIGQIAMMLTLWPLWSPDLNWTRVAGMTLVTGAVYTAVICGISVSESSGPLFMMIFALFFNLIISFSPIDTDSSEPLKVALFCAACIITAGVLTVLYGTPGMLWILAVIAILTFVWYFRETVGEFWNSIE